MKKKIITVEEFFRLKEMFSGSSEDKKLAWTVYDSAYEDKIILNQLMGKALLFKHRSDFIDAVSMEFIADSKKIYAFIEMNTMTLLYRDILNKLLKDE
tara:strand:- start:1530 stop:1823 length:294 start_codon:yes stop_codon:yes gene_type:complete